MCQVSGILSTCPLFLYSMDFLPVKESEVWRTAEDPASTPALEYSWAASSIYSILLAILNIDTRIVVWTVTWRQCCGSEIIFVRIRLWY
jgi:hypothetical protein